MNTETYRALVAAIDAEFSVVEARQILDHLVSSFDESYPDDPPRAYREAFDAASPAFKVLMEAIREKADAH